ncbi:MAG: ribosome silencing factor [Anaerolineales bacterium]
MELARAIVNALEEKKAEDILLLDIEKIASFASYFVICTGTSERMLNALGDAVLEMARGKFKKKGRLEGTPDGGWIILDYSSVVVHLFAPDTRAYYRLEELWNEGKVLLRVQ